MRWLTRLPRSRTALRRALQSLAVAGLLGAAAAGLLGTAVAGDGSPVPAGVVLTGTHEVDLMPRGQLYLADDETTPPAREADLPTWLERRPRVDRVNLFGGRYWFHATVQNDSPHTAWVIDPTGTLIEHLAVHVYVPGEPLQSFESGYTSDTAYMLHYGGDVQLPRGRAAQVLVRIDSRYFARYPSVYAATKVGYRKTVVSENVLGLCALGAMVTLAMYNLFVYLGVRDRAMLFYALYLLTATAAWGLSFHVGAAVFGWHDVAWHYAFFLLSAVFNSLFYLSFLQLRHHAPRLTRLSWLNIAACLAALPVCFVYTSYAHLVATTLISATLTLSLASGMVRLGQGFLPSRYFLAAFFSLLIPAILILPANFGLVPPMMRNLELFTLLGATSDAVLLAFALADKIRLLGREKDAYVAQLDEALRQASTDALTGIGNRHAFDRALSTLTAPHADPQAVRNTMLVMIDLDGLKRINDEQGHSQGDGLLRAFARELSGLQACEMTVYRLGGDEFAVLGARAQEERVRDELLAMEQRMRDSGYTACGVSFGIAFGSEINSSSQLLMHADARMYLHKTTKRVEPPTRTATPREDPPPPV